MNDFVQSTTDVHTGLNNSTECFNQAQQLNQSALDTGMSLTSGAWLGNASAMYMKQWQQIHDEFQTFINQGKQDVETTQQSVNAQSANDEG